MFSHLIGQCQRKVIMDYFEEGSAISPVSYSCCDVCENQSEDILDRREEVVTVLRAVQEIPGNGEIKV